MFFFNQKKLFLKELRELWQNPPALDSLLQSRDDRAIFKTHSNCRGVRFNFFNDIENGIYQPCGCAVIAKQTRAVNDIYALFKRLNLIGPWFNARFSLFFFY